jgi:hypothetical protein
MALIFSPSVRQALLTFPVYTPVTLGVNDMCAIVLRVERLAPFRPPLPIVARLVAWQDSHEIWVVAIAFRVSDRTGDPLTGDVYFNPRQQEDRRLLEYLASQERLAFFFCNKPLTEVIGKAARWGAIQRDEVAAFLSRLPAAHLTGDFDPDFERAKQAFQARYTVMDILP